MFLARHNRIFFSTLSGFPDPEDRVLGRIATSQDHAALKNLEAEPSGQVLDLDLDAAACGERLPALGTAKGLAGLGINLSADSLEATAGRAVLQVSLRGR